MEETDDSLCNKENMPMYHLLPYRRGSGAILVTDIYLHDKHWYEIIITGIHLNCIMGQLTSAEANNAAGKPPPTREGELSESPTESTPSRV